MFHIGLGTNQNLQQIQYQELLDQAAQARAEKQMKTTSLWSRLFSRPKQPTIVKVSQHGNVVPQHRTRTSAA